MRILLVEDDAMIATAVMKGLRQDGWTVDHVGDGQRALDALALEPYDALLLDLGLPRRDGIDVLRTLRARGQTLPVLIATARDAVADRVKGLDAGADDYLVKPFDLDELAARLRALVRRQAGRSEPLLRHGGIVLDPATRQVTCGGAPVVLSAREYAVLEALLNRPGRCCPRHNSKSASTAGVRRWRAMRSKFTSTGYARSSARMPSVPCAASAI